MNAQPCARFIIERKKGEGYVVARDSGSRAAELKQAALDLLDVFGHLGPETPKEVHAWIGPIGTSGDYVRVVVEKAENGYFTYWESWFESRHLPDNPALHDCRAGEEMRLQPAGVPRDVEGFLDSVQIAAYAGSQECFTAESGHPLQYLRIITDGFESEHASKLTWITCDAEFPVHIRVLATFHGGGAQADGLSAILTKRPLERVLKVSKTTKSSAPPSTSASSTPSGWLILLFLLGLVCGGVGGWFLHDVTPTLAAQLGSAAEKKAEKAEEKRDAGLKSQDQLELERRMKKVQFVARSSRELRERLIPFLRQEGLAASGGIEKDSMLLSSLIQPRPKIQSETLKTTEVTRLLEMLEALGKVVEEDGEKTN